MFFSLQATSTTVIYTLSLHDALPIFAGLGIAVPAAAVRRDVGRQRHSVDEYERIDVGTRRVLVGLAEDRKSTRLNSSHVEISYAVFCLKKKKRMISQIYR